MLFNVSWLILGPVQIPAKKLNESKIIYFGFDVRIP